MPDDGRTGPYDAGAGGGSTSGHPPWSERPGSLDRRSLLKLVGAGALGAGAAAALSSGAGASSLLRSGRSSRLTAATSGTIHIGYITPRTGDLAGFSESDPFVLKKIRGTSAYRKGITVGGKQYSIKITVLDSQSTTNRAAQVAQQLAVSTKVDLIVTANAPETTNPVASAAEQYQTPCLATVVPWESWYAGLGGDPLKPTQTFQYCTMFFFGMEQFAGTFIPMWNRIQRETKADKVFAGMYPNDADGNAFRAGFPPFAEKEGYKFVTGGAYTDGTTTYSSMIEKFKAGNCEFFSNAPLPPTFNTMWKQAITEDYKPKLATVAKVLLFPSTVAALGKLAENIATDAWWTPFSPYKSSLDGTSAKELATEWQDSSGNIWWQSLGSSYSLFEVAVEAFKAVDTPHDHSAVASALHSVNYSGMCGHIDFAKGPAPGVGIILPVGIQWKPGKKLLGKKFPWEPFVVDHSLNKEVKITGDLVAGTY
jgi:branched-chain amino acid transport system substrate-binding protein